MKINTNRNTLLAFYQIDENGHRQELPINIMKDMFIMKELLITTMMKAYYLIKIIQLLD